LLNCGNALYFAEILRETRSRKHQEFATMKSGTQIPDADPPSAITAISGEFDDIDRLAAAADGWGLDWIQLDRGPLHARFVQVGAPSMMLARFSFSRRFHQRGTPPPGVRTFGLNGADSPPLQWPDRVGRPDELVVFPSDGAFDVVSQPGFHGDTISIAEDRVRAVAELLELPDPLAALARGRDLVAVGPGRIRAVRGLLGAVHRSVDRPEDPKRTRSCWNDLEFEIVATLTGGLPLRKGKRTRAPAPTVRRRALARACEYIDEHASESPTIESVCGAAGVSWRTLNYAFRDRFGVTPKQYLQMVRLRRARRELIGSDPRSTIAEIAGRWGFWHMGQFAHDYRRHFGELPSETQRGR
jgi:AraC-like DNA-binding protein